MIKILELSKDYAKKYYNNDYNKMIEELDGVLFDDNNIKQAFNFGNGSFEDLKRCMNNNKKQFKYYDLINKKYI